MSVIRHIIKTGIIFGIIISLVQPALMSVVFLFDFPGVQGWAMVFMLREISSVIIYFMSGWHAAKKSGKRYVGALAALIAAGLGSFIPTIELYFLSLFISKSFIFGRILLSQEGNDAVFSCILGVVFGLIGAITGVRRANTSQDI